MASALSLPAATTAPARAVSGDHWNILTFIYEEDVNLVIGRQLLPQSAALNQAINALLDSPQTPALRLSGTPDQCRQAVLRDLPAVDHASALADAVYLVADAFCTLFDLEKTGLRLERLERAMCPRFHVDRVPVRLLLTLAGAGTEWLTEDNCERSQLGGGGEPCRSATAIQHLQAGDIALLKGEEWEGNEGRGLVHRSPAVSGGERRLMLTLDFT